MSELKEILYGKTAEVILADGISYTIRELAIQDLEGINLNKSNMEDPKNILELVWAMTKIDNPSLTKEKLGRLITFSMLKENSPFLQTVFSVLGINQAGNVQAGTA